MSVIPLHEKPMPRFADPVYACTPTRCTWPAIGCGNRPDAGHGPGCDGCTEPIEWCANCPFGKPRDDDHDRGIHRIQLPALFVDTAPTLDPDIPF